MNIFFQTILFFFAAFFSFYVPGRFLLHILKIKLEKWQEYFLCWSLGLSLFILLSYFSSWIRLPELVIFILLCCLAYLLYKQKLFSFFTLGKIDYWSVGIILVGSIVFSLTTVASGITTEQGLQLFGANNVDGVVHLAHIKNHLLSFPPTHPGISGVEFRGYHYFYDFLLSRFVIFYRFTPEDLFFRFFPFFLSLLYGASFWFFSSFLTKQNVAKRLVLFLAYFSQSFIFIFPLFKQDYTQALISHLVQPIGLMLDPSVVLTIALLLSAMALFPKIKESWKYAVVVGVILGILSQTKIYAGFIGISSLLLFSCITLIRHKTKYLLPLCVAVGTTGLLTIVTYFPNNFGVGHLTYAPLLIYRQYMQQFIFEQIHWEIKRIIYAEHNNILRIIQLYVEAVSLYWLVNLGIRIVPLFFIKKLFTKAFWQNDYYVMLFSSFLLPLFIPSFFIQSLSAFDIQQFLWILLALSTIPTGIVLCNIITKKNYILTAILFGFLTISAMQCLIFIYPYVTVEGRQTILIKDFAIYRSIKRLVPKDEFIVSLTDESKTIPLVSAMTGRSVYLEGEVIHYPLDEIYDERQKNLDNLQSGINRCDYPEIKKVMDKIGSKYLIVSQGKSCLDKHPEVKSFNKGDKIVFYQFK